ncbi:MAG: hypothetical protein R3336_02830 [Phycisphaeraceae bacterium]|nr:hypothetical protein [Phycisphaeraceae bacterium]
MAPLGCSTLTVDQPLSKEHAGNSGESQMAYWHGLAEQDHVSNDAAFHGILLMLEGKDPAGDYDQRVAELRKRDLLPDNFDGAANEAVSRGTLAVILVQHLDIKGGVIMRLTGPTPRYAVRELVYRNILPPSSPRQTLSGTAFIGLMGRVDDAG